MALFNGTKQIQGTRSHTALVKSGHMSPAEEWLLDPRFKQASMSSVFHDGVLFNYQYGGPGQEDVVIPKGRVVGVGAPIKDFVSKKFKTVMTLPGLALSGNTIGMVPYNLCNDLFQVDRFGGNQPSIITMDYVTLPYIPSATPESAMDQNGLLAEEQALSVDLRNPWGAVIGADIKVGDFLKATPSGRLTKWDPLVDSPVLVVGQILAQDFNAEPWGWLKWVMWDETARAEDDVFINRSGAGNLPSDDGYPFDPTYVNGNVDFPGYMDKFMTQPQGIPGLSDGSGAWVGYGKNDTEFKDMPVGSVPGVVVDNTLVTFQLKDYAGGVLKNIRTNTVTVQVGGVEVPATNLTIDYAKGVIAIKVMAADANKTVTATYKANQYGNPVMLDFKGVIGSFSILLKK